jgi:Tat protein secretion system quality control protein TatD with DNase activity
LLDRGVPAWFSFGASLINGNKRAGSACASIPLERLLVETDRAWQRQESGRRRICVLPSEDIRAVLSSVVDIRVEDAL